MDKYTASLLDKNHRLEGTLLELQKQLNQSKAEHDTLINDIEILRKDIDNLKNENKALLSQSNSYFDEWQNERTTSRGLREQCKEYAKDTSKYLYLTGHIRMKAEVNPSVSRYIDLVNYIDRLEWEK
ncbi:hypothetical protein [Staphylococcus carnosus]|uniref:hypothetical protein n=1 Tax=Staphylococcus carnosus TaxID=1281 RepID=UPI00081A2EE8|nr:hypothetical protein [Staphylococcus carnosus]ANZ33054.1 hypothetical protein BEK99_04215 [Staphylococcus carnosus]UTB85192.1 hypothetical protein A2I66_05820 [Staphylococcus carnosus]